MTPPSTKLPRNIKRFIPHNLSEYCPGRVCIFKVRSPITQLESFHSADIIIEERNSIIIKLKNNHQVRIGKMRCLLTYEKLGSYSTPTHTPPLQSNWKCDSRRHSQYIKILGFVDHLHTYGFKPVVIFTNSIGRQYALLLSHFLKEYTRLLT